MHVNIDRIGQLAAFDRQPDAFQSRVAGKNRVATFGIMPSGRAPVCKTSGGQTGEGKVEDLIGVRLLHSMDCLTNVPVFDCLHSGHTMRPNPACGITNSRQISAAERTE
jgi:hypothetical protein